jgi:hypothetical protein
VVILKINELCNREEYSKGYSSHMIGYGVLLYKNGTPYMQFPTEKEMHEYIKEEVNHESYKSSQRQ